MFLLDGTYKIPPVKEWTMEITHTKAAEARQSRRPRSRKAKPFISRRSAALRKL